MTTAVGGAVAPLAPIRASTPTPRSKQLATASSATSNSAAEVPKAPPVAATRGPGDRSGHGSGAGSTDALSDRTTEALIRRVLCPQQHLADKGREDHPSVDELLPPLTSRNDVDLQLYAILAIVLRQFVQSWYSKITPDETFVTEVLHVIAHCTRGLEQRFRKVDLEGLVLDEIADLLNKHITAYRTAHQPMSRYPESHPHHVYHSLCPLPSLSPVPDPRVPQSRSQQVENEAAYRQLLVQAALAVLLPTEDLENPCLTALVGQIFSELIIGNVIANKAAQPWIMWEGICILARLFEEKKAKVRGVGIGHRDATRDGIRAKTPQRWSIQGFFMMATSMAVMLLTSIRLSLAAIVASTSLPARVTTEEKGRRSSREAELGAHANEEEYESSQVPILEYKVWPCLSNLIRIDTRMPWLYGFMSLLQYAALNGPGRFARLNGVIDRILAHHIHFFFSPSHLPTLLRTLRGVLFPNNAPGTPSLFPPSSEAELHALRRRAARALLGLLPKGVGSLYFGGRLLGRKSPVRGGGESKVADEEEQLIDQVEDLLMVFDDEYCNKHLMYSVLEVILVRLIPEMSEKGVVELWEERLG